MHERERPVYSLRRYTTRRARPTLAVPHRRLPLQFHSCPVYTEDPKLRRLGTMPKRAGNEAETIPKRISKRHRHDTETTSKLGGNEADTIPKRLRKRSVLPGISKRESRKCSYYSRIAFGKRNFQKVIQDHQIFWWCTKIYTV